MWADELDPAGLSQGDLVDDLVFANVHPITPVGPRQSIRGGLGWPASTWSPDGDGICNVVARARKGTGIVLSHSCDIDKQSKKSRVFTAPVNDLKNLSVAEQQNVLQQRRIALFPLVGTARGDLYADLRLAMALDQRMFEERNRSASMTDDGRIMLQARLVLLFTRRA